MGSRLSDVPPRRCREVKVHKLRRICVRIATSLGETSIHEIEESQILISKVGIGDVLMMLTGQIKRYAGLL